MTCSFSSRLRPIVPVALLATLASCKAAAPTIQGTWDNGAGQQMILKPDGEALWVIADPQAADTFRLKYVTDFNASPPQLDLLGFDHGPLNGRNLYGIVEVKGKKSIAIAIDFAPGPGSQVRPTAFNPVNTLTYTKKKKK